MLDELHSDKKINCAK